MRYTLINIFEDTEDPYIFPISHFKYLSTMSNPHASFTTGMVAGISNWNGLSVSSELLHELSCFLASLIAALIAQ